jgi:molybdopterin molybdotransferase
METQSRLMALLPVEEAITRIVAGADPVSTETVDISDALNRTLTGELAALRTQPPFAASSMDGYAVRASDVSAGPLHVIGIAPAGAAFPGTIGVREAVRIFTGAPVPSGADAVVIQEDVDLAGDRITAKEIVPVGANIRPAGLDFHAGDVLLQAGRRLGLREIALAAAMGYGEVRVRRRPVVALISTGDELVVPGVMPSGAQIVAASAPGIAAYVAALGGKVHDLGIVRDDVGDLVRMIDRARALPADILVTLGGASVGDHDLVGKALADRGMELGFWRIAMRPGKPLMFGRMTGSSGEMRVLGLPGNPVSSIVCALLFLGPLIDALLGKPRHDPSEPAILGREIPANDGRQDYVRATLAVREAELPLVTPFDPQDSSMLGILATAQCLLVRPPNAPAGHAGDPCRIVRLP